MGPVYARRRGRAHAVTSSSSRRLALLYGRGLRLPPSPIHIHTASTSASQAVARHLRPFQQRMHRQRIAVTLVRLLILAGLVIAATLLLYLLGVPMPLPVTPLVAAAVVLVLGLCTLPWQRPAPAEMAYTLDQRLDLRQQIGSALELEADGQQTGRLAPLLRERAVRAMRDAEPAWVLPWPSLQRERWTLAAAAAAAGLSAIVALHVRPGPFPFTLSPGQPVAAHRPAAADHPPQAQGAAPVKVIALGNSGAQRAIPALNARRVPAGTRVGGRSAPNGVKSSSGAHFLPGQGRTGHGQSLQTGQGTPAGSNGHATTGPNGQTTPGHAGAGNQSSSGRGQRGQQGQQGQNGKGGQSHSLNLRSGKNSSAGGVGSPQQQALASLQNSISGSQGQQSKSGARGASSQQQGAHKGTRQGQGAAGRHSGAAGKQGQGNGQNGSNSNRSGQGQSGNQRNGQGQRGAGDGSSSFNPSQYGQNGNSSADYEAGRYGSRYGHPGEGNGADQGAATDPNAGSGKGSAASLSGGSTIALDGTGNRGVQGARLTVGVGAPNRGPASGGSTLYAGTGHVTVSTPGYVAPDSNDVSSDDSAIVRGYFTPSNSNQ